MDRNQNKRLIDNIYTSNEAAEYLNISTQRLNQLVHDKKLNQLKFNFSNFKLYIFILQRS